MKTRKSTSDVIKSEREPFMMSERKTSEAASPTTKVGSMTPPYYEQVRLVDHVESSAESEPSYWDFKGSPTRYATHGIHTYLAAMIPHVARKAISISKPTKLLDPFCGGGAVLVESVLAGIPCVGVDTNPLAIVVSRAKTKYIDPKHLRTQLHTILHDAAIYDEPVLQFSEKQKVHYWYKDYMFKPLSGLTKSIQRIDDSDVKEFFRCMMSSVARDVSLTYRNEIRLRRLEPPDLKKFNPNVLSVFERNCLEAMRRIAKLPTTEASVIEGSVFNLPFENDDFTTIVCSPPYGDERNGVPYIQFAKNMLFWLGYSWDEVAMAKKGTLGWVNKRVNIPTPDSPTLERCLDIIKDHPKSVLEAKAFYYDYGRALREMARVVNDTIVIVVGQRVLRNTVFDNAQITIELLSGYGVRLYRHDKRRLPSKRLPKMREFGAAIDEEHILFFDMSNKCV